VIEERVDVIHIFFERRLVSGVLVVLDETKDPVERVTFDAVVSGCGALQVFTDEVPVSKGHQSCGLGRMRISCPGDAVAAIHEESSKVVLTEVGFDDVSPGVPDAREHGIAAREAATIVGGLSLANGAHSCDVPGVIEGEDVNPTEADTFVEFGIQFEPVGVLIAMGWSCFETVRRTHVFDGRLVVFADTHLDGSGEVGAIELEPGGAFDSKFEANGSNAIHHDRFLEGCCG
jgi:hypothetical protein